MSAAFSPPGAISSRDQAQQWLKLNGYAPSIIRISPAKRIGARLFSPHVHFVDHPQESLMSGVYQVVSVHSVVSLTRRIDPATVQLTVQAD